MANKPEQRVRIKISCPTLAAKPVTRTSETIWKQHSKTKRRADLKQFAEVREVTGPADRLDFWKRCWNGAQGLRRNPIRLDMGTLWRVRDISRGSRRTFSTEDRANSFTRRDNSFSLIIFRGFPADKRIPIVRRPHSIFAPRDVRPGMKTYLEGQQRSDATQK